MPKKNREYWQERYEQLEKSAHSYSLSTYAQIEPAFTLKEKEKESIYEKIINNTIWNIIFMWL